MAGDDRTLLQHLYGAVFLAVVAVLVLASLAYGGGLAWVKVLIGIALLAFSGWLAAQAARARRRRSR